MALRFRFFLANDFSLLFALFWLFLAAITGFVYFVTAFVAKPQTAVYVGFLVFLVSRGRRPQRPGAAGEAPVEGCSQRSPESVRPDRELAPFASATPQVHPLAQTPQPGWLDVPGHCDVRHALHAPVLL
jgi:hypothetical protein